MNVQNVMTSGVQFCGPDTNLATVAKIMWDTDCGVLPVLNVERQVLGMLTDRDICMACATKNRVPSEITARETVREDLYVQDVRRRPYRHGHYEAGTSEAPSGRR